MRRGVDYSWGRPAPAALRAAGFTFAVRYLSWDPTTKNLTRGEAELLAAAGLDLVLVWENHAGDFLVDSAVTGQVHARAARAQAVQVGAPDDVPIYFAVDKDVTADTMDEALAYVGGVASVIGADRVGVYGEYDVVTAVRLADLAAYSWQTAGWSGGKWAAHAQLRQVKNTQKVDGAPVDFDEAWSDDFGAWYPGQRSYR
jgi:hypothetical protein